MNFHEIFPGYAAFVFDIKRLETAIDKLVTEYWISHAGTFKFFLVVEVFDEEVSKDHVVFLVDLSVVVLLFRLVPLQLTYRVLM